MIGPIMIQRHSSRQNRLDSSVLSQQLEEAVSRIRMIYK